MGYHVTLGAEDGGYAAVFYIMPTCAQNDTVLSAVEQAVRHYTSGAGGAIVERGQVIDEAFVIYESGDHVEGFIVRRTVPKPQPDYIWEVTS